MFCPACGKPIPDTARFCQHCGANVTDLQAVPEQQSDVLTERRCPQCGFTLDADAAFCDNCGAGINAQITESAPQPDVETERRCPQCGFTLDADAVFCDNCGAGINAQITESVPQPEVATERHCPQCGFALDGDAVFCDNCGINTSAPPVTAAPPTGIDTAPTARNTEQNKILCKRCGYLVPVEHDVCPRCGNKKLKAAGRTINAPGPSGNRSVPGIKPSKLLLIGLAVAGVILATLLFVIYGDDIGIMFGIATGNTGEPGFMRVGESQSTQLSSGSGMVGSRVTVEYHFAVDDYYDFATGDVPQTITSNVGDTITIEGNTGGLDLSAKGWKWAGWTPIWRGLDHPPPETLYVGGEQVTLTDDLLLADDEDNDFDLYAYWIPIEGSGSAAAVTGSVVNAGEPIVEPIILANIYARCASQLIKDENFRPNTELTLEDIFPYIPNSLGELFVWNTMQEYYPDHQMPVSDFDALLHEVCGAGLDAMAAKLEDAGYTRNDGGYIGFANVSASVESSNGNVTYENGYMLIDLEQEVDGNTTSWRIVGQPRDDNLFAPYELVSITLN